MFIQTCNQHNIDFLYPKGGLAILTLKYLMQGLMLLDAVIEDIPGIYIFSIIIIDKFV